MLDLQLDGLNVKKCSGHGIDIGGDEIGGTDYYASGSVKNSIVEYAAMNNYNGDRGGSGWQSGLKISHNGKDIELSNNTIKNNWGEGVAITRGENVTFKNNTIFNSYSVNIYIDNSINTIVDSNFAYCNDSSLILKDGKKASGISVGEEFYTGWGNQMSTLKVFNNIVYNCSRGFTWYGTDTNAASGGLDNTIIANNTFYLLDNTSSAIYLDGEVGDDIEFKNNIIVSNAGAVWIDSAIGTYDFDYKSLGKFK
ncbi:MAG: right-handed parallel beta-helix repeat-containing protein [Candidatus Dojkabacteria bacterium]|nr:right-handed parallel beta-helix repeat-containing protein [Candidatus Dojkabacteria bacterium]MDQ7020506.1 right-handed parallel beta-helix repeat-containing protein [Candidatus Dojkabacteria bacterium]